MEFTHRSGALAILGTGVVFSFGSLFFRATDDVDAWQYLSFRGTGAFVTLLSLLLIQRRGRYRETWLMTQRRHVVAGVMLGSLMIAFIVSLTHTDTAFVLFFQAGAPVSAAIFSWLLLGERMSTPAVFATIGALIGVAIMSTGGLGDGIGWPILIVGSMPVVLGLYGVLIRSGPAVDPLVPALTAGFTAATAGVIVSLIGDGLRASAHDTLIGLAAGVLLIALPVPFFTMGQRSVPAPEAVLLLMSEIVLAPVWVWLAFDEQPSEATMIGGVVMLLSVVWLTVQTVRPDQAVRTSRG